mmetsp:Transcript_54282/g.129368  ORF Transcript_54282/g.129368 Transcript_54282/m.129368 type:complete len:503 (+) Transcript_54282:154-1662(+)
MSQLPALLARRAVTGSRTSPRRSASSATPPARRRSCAVLPFSALKRRKTRSSAASPKSSSVPTTKRSHYEVLGVAKTATTSELRAAFLKKVLESHPDKGGNAEHFHSVVSAFEVLQDPAGRTTYDEQLARDADSVSRGGARPGRQRIRPRQSEFAKLAELLQKLSPACRKDVITNRFSQRQRVALETHMKEVRAKAAAEKDPFPLDRCADDSSARKAGKGSAGAVGICRTKNGYHAQVTWNSLSIKAKVRAELKDAVYDHICLLQVMHLVRRELPAHEKALLAPTDIGDAVAAIARSEAAGEFVAAGLQSIVAIQVNLSVTYFLGTHSLMLHRRELAAGIAAWLELRRGREQLSVYKGRAAMTDLQALDKQWQNLRGTYLRLEQENGADGDYLEARLRLWEEENRPARMQKDVEVVAKAQPLSKARRNSDGQDDASLTLQISRLLAKEKIRVEGPAKSREVPAQTCLKRGRGRHSCRARISSVSNLAAGSRKRRRCGVASWR